LKGTNLLFESSWEVCNKVGGIYTVLMSKAARMKDQYGDNYFAIGPFFPGRKIATFEEAEAPEFIKKAFETLKSKGVECHFGTWLIKGEPQTILVDSNGLLPYKDDIKKTVVGIFWG